MIIIFTIAKYFIFVFYNHFPGIYLRGFYIFSMNLTGPIRKDGSKFAFLISDNFETV